jgi:large subunit ribosomal protein L47
MSAMRGTGLGPWIKLSVKPEDVEAPRKIEIQAEESPDHGLWNFFNPQRTILSTPVEESRHGMAPVLCLDSVANR